MNQHYDLLVHVDLDNSRVLGIALNNITNYMNALPDEKYDVVLLANGPAVTLLRQETCPHLDNMVALISRGVRFEVCANALKKFEVTLECLVEGCTVVPAGVVALVDLQRQGFAYIKP